MPIVDRWPINRDLSVVTKYQAVLDTVHVTEFGQSNVVSAGAMADIFRCELRIGCRFSTDFCARHENQMNIFWELLVQYLGQLFGNSQWQVRIFCINFSQWKSYNVENVCLSSMLDMDILLVVCGVTGISILDYFCVKL